LNVVALTLDFGDLRLVVAEEGDQHGHGRRSTALELAESQGVGADGEIIPAVGLYPQADFLDGGLIELDVDRHRLEPGEARGIHARQDVGRFARLEISLDGGGADTAAGDANAGDVDRAASLVDHPERVREGWAARDGPEIFGELFKERVCPCGREGGT